MLGFKAFRQRTKLWSRQLIQNFGRIQRKFNYNLPAFIRAFGELHHTIFDTECHRDDKWMSSIVYNLLMFHIRSVIHKNDMYHGFIIYIMHIPYMHIFQNLYAMQLWIFLPSIMSCIVITILPTSHTTLPYSSYTTSPLTSQTPSLPPSPAYPSAAGPTDVRPARKPSEVRLVLSTVRLPTWRSAANRGASSSSSAAAAGGRRGEGYAKEHALM